MVLVFGILAILLFPQIEPTHLATSSFALSDLFLPYGVILFSLGGVSILGEVKTVLADKKKFKAVIIIGTVIPILVYFLFMLIIVGVTGPATSEDAIRGLMMISPTLTKIGAWVAILSMSSAFLGLGTILKDVFNIDFKIPYFWAWFMAVVPPFLLFMLGLHSFILVISITGALMAGLEGVMIILMHQKAVKQGDQYPPYEIPFPPPVKIIFLAVLGLGILYVTYNVLGNIFSL
jgi:tyrosine-specific transport protein